MHEYLQYCSNSHYHCQAGTAVFNCESCIIHTFTTNNLDYNALQLAAVWKKQKERQGQQTRVFPYFKIIAARNNFENEWDLNPRQPRSGAIQVKNLPC